MTTERAIMRLRGTTVAVPVTNGFADDELTEPVKAMESHGANVTLVGPDETSKQGLTGRGGTVAAADATVDDVGPEDFAALFIPGGASPEQLSGDDRMLRLVRVMAITRKPVAAICRGPQLLAAANAVDRRIVTSHPSVAADLQKAGAVFVDQAVAVDANFVTARYPSDLPRFVEAMLRMMEYWAQQAA